MPAALRLAFRYLAHHVSRTCLRILAHVEIRGLDKLPPGGPLIIAFNHLSHIDAPLLIGTIPYPVEPIALVDLLSVPVTSQLLRAYGVIPVHRDQYDRRMIKRALGVLAQGRVLVIAPEARRSVTRAMERARAGVAYLALRSGVPILPVAITGTERALEDLRSFKRPRLTVTIGEPITLSQDEGQGRGRRERLQRAADEIMIHIARLLPPEYRGVYQEYV